MVLAHWRSGRHHMSTSYRSVRYTVVCNWLLLFVSSTKYLLLSKDSVQFMGGLNYREILRRLSRVNTFTMVSRFNNKADLDNNRDNSTVSIKESRSGPMPRMSHPGIRSVKLSKQLSTNLLMKNALFHSDNLVCMNYLLRHGFENKISLVYIDPPFLSGERYFHRVENDKNHAFADVG